MSSPTNAQGVMFCEESEAENMFLQGYAASACSLSHLSPTRDFPTPISPGAKPTLTTQEDAPITMMDPMFLPRV